MNAKLVPSLILVLLLVCGLQAVRAETCFPGAVGFGTQTPAGRGGRVIRVTNLKAKGPGSLREALEAKGPRIVVFEVGGVIDLGKKSITIKEPFLTIAGQTAPAPGITLIRGSLFLITHDLLIQHIRVRPGDAGMPKKSGWSPDAISSAWGDAYNIVVDHCSCTWAIDENLSASSRIDGGRATASHDVTFSNCLIAEGLNNSSHEKGPHSKGTLIHDFCNNISIIGNLYAHNVERNAFFKGNTLAAYVNNFVYNPGNFAVRVSYVVKEYAGTPQKVANGRVAMVGNVLRYGPNTKPKQEFASGSQTNGELFLADNLAFDQAGQTVPIAKPTYIMLNDKPCWPAGLDPIPASAVEAAVLRQAGARPAERDPIDQRIIDTVRTRTGKVLDSQDEVGGYPKITPTQCKLDVPTTPAAVEAWLAKLAAQVERR